MLLKLGTALGIVVVELLSTGGPLVIFVQASEIALFSVRSVPAH
jgi:hypothetical protein